MRRKKIVVFTGAGISAESGIRTFRDSKGLWENYRIEDVATPVAWFKNPKLVLNFYNQRRKQIFKVLPNAAHYALTELENKFDVTVITQNIDDLHERAGSTHVIHLHGEIKKARCTANPNHLYEMSQLELNLGDKCSKCGKQLRPHVVWFHEPVPNMAIACKHSEKADVLIVIGTSLVVMPAAGLVSWVPSHCKKYLIDKNVAESALTSGFIIIEEAATSGTRKVVDTLI